MKVRPQRDQTSCLHGWWIHYHLKQLRDRKIILEVPNVHKYKPLIFKFLPPQHVSATPDAHGASFQSFLCTITTSRAFLSPFAYELSRRDSRNPSRQNLTERLGETLDAAVKTLVVLFPLHINPCSFEFFEPWYLCLSRSKDQNFSSTSISSKKKSF